MNMVIDGYPIDHVVSGRNVVSGNEYTILANSMAVNALNKSFIAPAHELKQMLDSNKRSKNIHVNGVNDNPGNNTLLTTYGGAIATREAIAELKQKQDQAIIEKAAKNKRKDDGAAKRLEQKIKGNLIKKEDISYFKKCTTADEQKTYINKMMKKDVDLHIKAFGGSIIDINKKAIKIGILKDALYTLIVNALNNENNEDEGPESDDDEEDDDGHSPPHQRQRAESDDEDD